MTLSRRAALVCTLLVSAAVLAQGSEQAAPMTFKVPELSEEEAQSDTIPEEFRCDACKGVVHQLTVALSAVRPRPRKELEAQGKHAIREQAARLAEALEGACLKGVYQDYAVKTDLQGEARRLAGPGIESSDEPGVRQGGAKWPARLRAVCERLVGEWEESELAELWRAGSLPGLCAADCGLAASPRPRPRTRPRPRPRPRPTPEPARRLEDSEAQVGRRAATGLEELPPPPHSCQPVSAANWTTFHDGWKGKAKRKFRVVLFYDATPMSARAVAIVELAARKIQKASEKAVRKVAFGRYDSTQGDTYGYRLKSLPKLMLFRTGYKNPKMFSGAMNGPDDVADWLREEVLNRYLKDDPEEFPRAEGYRTDL